MFLCPLFPRRCWGARGHTRLGWKVFCGSPQTAPPGGASVEVIRGSTHEVPGWGPAHTHDSQGSEETGLASHSQGGELGQNRHTCSPRSRPTSLLGPLVNHRLHVCRLACSLGCVVTQRRCSQHLEVPGGITERLAPSGLRAPPLLQLPGALGSLSAPSVSCMSSLCDLVGISPFKRAPRAAWQGCLAVAEPEGCDVPPGESTHGR